MPQDLPTVSVVMSVLNSGQLLERTVKSVLSQQGVELEFVIVDDGSNPPVKDLLGPYSKDDRIKLIEQPNQGITLALIHGFKHTEGEFIARIDVGDEMLPDRLRLQASQLLESDVLSLVCSSVELYTEEGEPLFKIAYSKKELITGLSDPLSPRGKSPFHASVMMRKSAYQLVGGYRREFYFAQDLDLFSRLIEVGDIEVNPKCLTKGVFSASGVSARHTHEQSILKAIVAQLIARRSKQEEEATLLHHASEVNPSRRLVRERNNFTGNYFIGKCLYDAKSKACIRYLRRAIRTRPLSAKAWCYLILSLRFGVISN